MSLRTVYTGALDTKLAEARAAGRTFVVTTNLASITSSISAAAAQGKKVFAFSLPVSYQPQDLRLLGPLWKAYQTGVEEGLASEDLMNDNVVVTLDVSDTVNTAIKLSFTM